MLALIGWVSLPTALEYDVAVNTPVCMQKV